jgi:hypothetical protein
MKIGVEQLMWPHFVIDEKGDVDFRGRLCVMNVTPSSLVFRSPEWLGVMFALLGVVSSVTVVSVSSPEFKSEVSYMFTLFGDFRRTFSANFLNTMLWSLLSPISAIFGEKNWRFS